MPNMDRKSNGSEGSLDYIVCGDLCFEKTCSGADYTTAWSPKMTDRMLHNVTASLESTIMFAAREAWICSTAPKCIKQKCQERITSSVLAIKSKRSRDGGKKISWVWRYRCCHSRITIFRDSMFYNSHYGPGAILEILWKMSSRTPVSMISRLILGVESSEVFKWVTFFRDVTGWYEDKHIMMMGGSVYRREPLINVFLWVYFWSSCR